MITQDNRIITFSEESRELIQVGVEKLADAVRVTMGPSGKNVLIEQSNAPPVLTKDGVTVARAINLKDRFANLGVQLVREAAQRTAEEAGDGTTTATVLACAIFQEGLKALAGGHELRDIRSGIRQASEELCNEVRENAVPVKSDEDLRRVANISVNNEPELAELIVEALKAVGNHGTVTVDEAKGFDSSLDIVEGCELDRGYVSPYFVNKPARMSCELIQPAILVTDQRISSVHDIMYFMEEAARDNRPLVIIGPETTGEALQGLILNHSKNLIRACVLAAPEFGTSRLEALHDIAILLGTKVLTGEPSSWKNQKLKDLGSCKKMTSYRFRTIFIGVKGTAESIDERIGQIKEASFEYADDKEMLSVFARRIKRMNSGIGILRVGGSTEAEISERKDRVEDALYATKAAMEEGIVAGGGSLLARLAKTRLASTDDLSIGHSILYKAACEPLKQIAANCGSVPEVVLERIIEKPKNFGYNGISGEVCNLMKAGIVDPAKVTRLALQNAASVSINLLSIGCAMVMDDEL
jgi:chaperonin GroEL